METDVKDLVRVGCTVIAAFRVEQVHQSVKNYGLLYE